MVTIISLFNTVSRFTMLNTHQSNKQKNFKTKKSLNKIDYIFYLCICTLTSALYWNRYSYVFEPTGRFCWSICFFILLFKFCCRYFFLCRHRTVYISCCNSIYQKINVTLLTYLQHFLIRTYTYKSPINPAWVLDFRENMFLHMDDLQLAKVLAAALCTLCLRLRGKNCTLVHPTPSPLFSMDLIGFTIQNELFWFLARKLYICLPCTVKLDFGFLRVKYMVIQMF